MRVVALSVHSDEPAWDMYCGPASGRFVTRVRVVRADRLADYTIDHGPEDDFSRTPPLYMPSMLEECVGRLLEYAERHRHDLRWYKRVEELKAESTMIQDVIEQEAQRVAHLHNRSVIGPHQSTQRGHYSRDAAWRRFQDERAERTGKRVFTT